MTTDDWDDCLSDTSQLTMEMRIELGRAWARQPGIRFEPENIGAAEKDADDLEPRAYLGWPDDPAAVESDLHRPQPQSTPTVLTVWRKYGNSPGRQIEMMVQQALDTVFKLTAPDCHDLGFLNPRCAWSPTVRDDRGEVVLATGMVLIQVRGHVATREMVVSDLRMPHVGWYCKPAGRRMARVRVFIPFASPLKREQYEKLVRMILALGLKGAEVLDWEELGEPQRAPVPSEANDSWCFIDGVVLDPEYLITALGHEVE